VEQSGKEGNVGRNPIFREVRLLLIIIQSAKLGDSIIHGAGGGSSPWHMGWDSQSDGRIQFSRDFLTTQL